MREELKYLSGNLGIITQIRHSLMFKYLSSENDLIQIKNIFGSSAINLLGRFACGSEDILEITQSIVDYENTVCEDDTVYAEILHLPENRTGNVILRPSLRKYEIPYLSKSFLPQNNQIDINDLYLSIKKENYS